MSIWKNFCRTIESKIVRKHFGDLVPLINACAVFEFTQGQIEAAEHYEPDLHGVPPFPFPRMCCVGPRDVTLLQSPTMDEAQTLRFDTIVWVAGSKSDNDDWIFQTASCAVETAGAALTVVASDVRGIALGRYHDKGLPLVKIDPNDPVEVAAHQAATVSMMNSLIEKAAARGDQEALAARREQLDRLVQMYADLSDGRKTLADLGERFGVVQLDAVSNAFQLGLQEVQWINKPNHYTVEVGALEPPRKRKGDPRVRRLAERTRYIVLTKEEIAAEWHRVHRGGTHASPLPHLRRGHYRTLNRATAGERLVWVRAAHVNGTCVEWRDGDVRYRVI